MCRRLPPRDATSRDLKPVRPAALAGPTHRCGWALVAAAALLSAPLSGLASGAGALSAGAVPPETGVVAPRPARLDSRTLVRLALMHNAEMLSARLQTQVAAAGFEAETGLYQPILSAAVRAEARDRRRTIEERLNNAAGGLVNLDERVRAGEVGMRMRLPLGGELGMAWRATQRRSNVIGSASFAPSESESVGALVLTLRQPLMRGVGRDVVETDLRLADAEREIARWQFRQQALRVTGDALSAYAQLQRAVQSQQLRQEATENARTLVEDVRVRVTGGRLAPSAIEDADSALSARESDLARGVQGIADAEARIRVLLDLPSDDGGWALPGWPEAVDAALPLTASMTPASASAQAAQRLPSATAGWPPLRIAQLRRTQAEQRLLQARSRALPALELQGSYSSNSLEQYPRIALREAARGGSPDWTIGLALELPIGGDTRARAQVQMQRLRLEQASVEVHGARQALASDLHNRVVQLAAVQDERAPLLRELRSRQELLSTERAQLAAGVAPAARVLRREADLLDARLRLLDVQARLALAVVGLQLVDGSLLDAYDVSIEE